MPGRETQARIRIRVRDTRAPESELFKWSSSHCQSERRQSPTRRGSVTRDSESPGAGTSLRVRHAQFPAVSAAGMAAAAAAAASDMIIDRPGAGRRIRVRVILDS